MQVKFKRLNETAVVPKYAKPGDAAMDLFCTKREWDPETDTAIYSTGLALEIPDGFVGLVFPRSSIYKTNLSLCNAVAVLDSQFRGEVKLIFSKVDRLSPSYQVGDRVGQLMILPYPKIELIEVDQLSETERGTGGLGSTGR